MLAVESIIFDLDGTLWNTCTSCAIGWNNVLSRYQIPFRRITADDIAAVAGRPHEECIRQVFKGLPEYQIQLLSEGTAEEDNRIVAELGGDLYPGVNEGLATLSQRYSLFIVSNCQAGYIETFLKWFGHGHYFKDFECWGNTKRPKAENILSIIERNQLRQPVYVGDTEGDRTAANSAKIPFVFVDYGFGKCSEFDLGFSDFTSFTKHFINKE